MNQHSFAYPLTQRKRPCVTTSVALRGAVSFVLHLRVIEFERCSTPENLDHNLELLFLAVHFLDLAAESAERSVSDLYGLTDHVGNEFVVGDFNHLVGSSEHTQHLSLTECFRLGILAATAEEVYHI